jgi:cell division protein DivIC
MEDHSHAYVSFCQMGSAIGEKYAREMGRVSESLEEMVIREEAEVTAIEVANMRTVSPPQVNNRKGQKRRIRLVLFFVLCLFVWAGYTLYVQSEDLAGKKAELEALKQEMNAVQAEQAELTYKASRLYDQDYIAELARKQFFYTKPGESIYVIPE